MTEKEKRQSIIDFYPLAYKIVKEEYYFDPDERRMVVHDALAWMIKRHDTRISAITDVSVRRAVKYSARSFLGRRSAQKHRVVSDAHSLQQTVSNDPEDDAPNTYEDLIPTENPTPLENCIEKEKRENLLGIVNQLNDKDREIIERYFGLNGYDEHPLRDIVPLTHYTCHQGVSLKLKRLIRWIRNQLEQRS